MLQTKQRTTWVDLAKAITIFLVVLGHTLRDGTVQHAIYSFHVVAFFLLSGMTCKADGIPKRIKNDFLRIMVPYYFFGIASILIFTVLGKFAADQFGMMVDTSFFRNIQGLVYACPIGSRLKFNAPLWFLPCLFATKLLYYMLFKLCRGKLPVILLCSIALAVFGFWYARSGYPGLPFNLSVSFKMLVFFTLGRLLYQHGTQAKVHYITGWKAILAGALLLGAAVLVSLRTQERIVYSSDYFPHIGSFFFTALAGTLGICCISMGIGSGKSLEYVGKHTLGILLMHKFPVLLFQTVGPQTELLTQYDSFACIGMSAVIAVVSIALCLVIEVVIRRFLPFLLGDFSIFTRRQNS